jgi:hypothetical protein
MVVRAKMNRSGNGAGHYLLKQGKVMKGQGRISSILPNMGKEYYGSR